MRHLRTNLIPGTGGERGLLLADVVAVSTKRGWRCTLLPLLEDWGLVTSRMQDCALGLVLIWQLTDLGEAAADRYEKWERTARRDGQRRAG